MKPASRSPNDSHNSVKAVQKEGRRTTKSSLPEADSLLSEHLDKTVTTNICLYGTPPPPMGAPTDDESAQKPPQKSGHK